MPRRFFSIEEANALVPVLQDQLEQLQRLQHVAQDKFEEMERLKQVGKDSSGNFILGYDLKLSQEIFDQAITEANDLIRQVNDQGCEIRNIAMGLVDFPARVDGHEVLFCWQAGESEILFYHERHAGFQGRRALTSDEGAGNSGSEPSQSGF